MLFKSIFKFPNILVLVVFLLLIRSYFKSYLENKKAESDLLIGNAQDIGNREEQEDSFSTIKNENGTLAVLADGMGGFSAGKKASNLAVKTFLEEFAKTYEIHPINKFLINTTHISSAKVLDLAEVKGRKIGTTLIAVLINDERLHWVAAGDSIIYFYRNNELFALNEQHIYINKLKAAYEAGEISREEALNHPRRDQLTSYLGYEDFHEIDYGKSPIELKRGDKIILCSDGILDGLSEIELERILDKPLHPAETAEVILESVVQKQINNQDNATVIVIEKNK